MSNDKIIPGQVAQLSGSNPDELRRVFADNSYAVPGPTRIRIVLLNEHAKMPTLAHASDSGADLYASEGLGIGPGYYAKVKLGIAVVLPPGYEAVIRPRSSLSANGIICALGTIDQGYTGELSAVLYNVSKHPFVVMPGDKIAQLVIQKLPRIELYEDSQSPMPETARGGNGWGSSGR